MIVLQNGEQILRQDDATLENEGKSLGEGTLYLTNARLMFELKEGGVPRMLTIQVIQAATPLRENRLAVSYLSEDGHEIHTDRYRLKGRARVEEWYDDFSAFLKSRRRVSPEPKQKETQSNTYIVTEDDDDASQAGLSQNHGKSQARGEEHMSIVKIDLSTKTMEWQKIPDWRRRKNEHIWQGMDELSEMTKEQWLAYKRESAILDKKLGELRVEYFESKKRGDKKRCREIKEEMKIVDLELYGKGELPYTDIKADTWPETKDSS